MQPAWARRHSRFGKSGERDARIRHGRGRRCVPGTGRTQPVRLRALLVRRRFFRPAASHRCDLRAGRLLPELDARLRAEGCRVELRACFSGTAIGYDIVYLTSEQNTGFKITFNNRKKELWRFGLLSGVGEKAMLEDFERLDPALQALFLRICRPCSGCGGCTKSGKNARFTVTVQANGTSHALCPQFPQHEWQKPDRALADTLCLYLRTQLRYI